MLTGAGSSRDPSRSGPVVAALFQRLLALVFLVAWASLGLQIAALAGERGLRPLRLAMDVARAQGPRGFLEHPTIFFFVCPDYLLTMGPFLGAALALGGVPPEKTQALLFPLRAPLSELRRRAPGHVVSAR